MGDGGSRLVTARGADSTLLRLASTMGTLLMLIAAASLKELMRVGALSSVSEKERVGCKGLSFRVLRLNNGLKGLCLSDKRDPAGMLWLSRTGWSTAVTQLRDVARVSQ